MSGKIRYAVAPLPIAGVCLTVFDGEKAVSLELSSNGAQQLADALTGCFKTGESSEAEVCCFLNLEAQTDRLSQESRKREELRCKSPSDSSASLSPTAGALFQEARLPHSLFPQLRIPQAESSQLRSLRAATKRLAHILRRWVLTCLGRKQNSGNVSIKKDAA